MKNYIIIKKKIKSFNNAINVSGDKSISIRCVLLASQGIGTSKIYNLLESEDVINSLKSIKRLGYFESVNYRLQDSNIPKSLDIIIEVKEMNTGSVSFGVGYSSLNDTSMTFGLNERNFLGEGKKLRLEANLSSKKTTYNFLWNLKRKIN